MVQSKNPVFTNFSRKNFTSPNSESFIPRDLSIPKSPFSTAMNTERRCSKSARIKCNAAPKSSMVCDSVNKWSKFNYRRSTYVNYHYLYYQRAQLPLYRRLLMVSMRHELYYRIIFPNNLARDSLITILENFLSLRPVASSLPYTI